MKRTSFTRIIDCFELGFEEMETRDIITGKDTKRYHMDDFVGGSMKRFYNYTVNRFAEEFSVLVCFR